MKTIEYQIGNKVRFNTSTINEAKRLLTDTKILAAYGKELVERAYKNSLGIKTIIDTNKDDCGNTTYKLTDQKIFVPASTIEIA